MTYSQAERILVSHDQQSRPAADAAQIDVLAVFTHRDHPGQVFQEWETIPLTTTAIRDWLGY